MGNGKKETFIVSMSARAHSTHVGWVERKRYPTDKPYTKLRSNVVLSSLFSPLSSLSPLSLLSTIFEEQLGIISPLG